MEIHTSGAGVETALEKQFLCHLCGEEVGSCDELEGHILTKHPGSEIGNKANSRCLLSCNHDNSVTTCVRGVFPGKKITVIDVSKEQILRKDKRFECFTDSNNPSKRVELHNKLIAGEKNFDKNVFDAKNYRSPNGENSYEGESYFKTVRLLRTSQEERARGEGLYRCSECSKSGRSTSNMYKHMRNNHKGFVIKKLLELDYTSRPFHDQGVYAFCIYRNSVRWFKCSRCDYTASGVRAVHVHIRKKHEGFKIVDTNELGQCDNNFNSNGYRDGRNRPGVNSFKGNVFSSQKYFDKHFRNYQGKSLWDYSEVSQRGEGGMSHREHVGKYCDKETTVELKKECSVKNIPFNKVGVMTEQTNSLNDGGFEGSDVNLNVLVVGGHTMELDSNTFRQVECQTGEGLDTLQQESDTSGELQDRRVREISIRDGIECKEISVKDGIECKEISVKDGIECKEISVKDGIECKEISVKDGIECKEISVMDGIECKGISVMDGIECKGISVKDRIECKEISVKDGIECKEISVMDGIECEETVDRDTVRSVNGDSVRFDDDNTLRNTEVEIQNIISKLSDDVCDNTGDRDIDRLVGDGGHDENQGTDKVEEAITNVSHPKEKVGMSSVSKCVSINESGQENKGMAKLSNDLTSSEKIKRNGITLLKILSPLSKSVHHKHPQFRKMVKIIKSSTEQIERGIKRYQCSECDYLSGNTGAMYRHMKRNHKDFAIEKLKQNRIMSLNISKPLAKSTPDKTKIVQIVKTTEEEREKGERMYICSVCGYDSNHSGIMYKHMRKVHVAYVVKRLTDYKIKTGAHKDLKFTNGFDDDIGKEIDLDLLTHRNVKGQFSDTRKIVKIIKTSTEQIEKGIKRYTCSECGYAGEVTGNLYKHMGRVHQDFTIRKLTDFDTSFHPRQKVNKEMMSSGIDLSKMVGKNICSDESEKGAENVNQDSEGLYLNDDSDVSVSDDDDDDDNSKMETDGFDTDNGKDTDVDLDTCVSHKDRGQSLTSNKAVHINDKYQYLDTQKTVEVIKTSKRENKSGKQEYRCSGCDYFSSYCSHVYKHMGSVHKDFVIKQGIHSDTNIHRQKDLMVNSSYFNDKDVECSIKMEACDNSADNEINADVDISVRRQVGGESLNCDKVILRNGTSQLSDSRKIVKVVKRSKEEIKRGMKRYRCSECGYQSGGTGPMYKHMKRIHKGFVIKKLTNYDTRIHQLGHKEMMTSSIVGGENLNSNKVKLMNGTSQQSDCRKIVKVVKRSKEEIKRGMKYGCSECGYQSGGTGPMYKHMKRIHKGFVIKRLIDTDRKNYSHERLLIGKKLKSGLQLTEGGKQLPGSHRFECFRCNLKYFVADPFCGHIVRQHNSSVTVKIDGNKNGKIEFE